MVLFQRLFFALFAFSNLMFGGSVQTLPALPNQAIANSIQVDAVGNIYVAGWLPQDPNSPHGAADAFVAKLSPDGSQVIWFTVLSGSADDRAVAIALGSDNSVYVTGDTYSADFPTTSGSMQPAQGYDGQAFAAKLDPKGAVRYATYIGGTSHTFSSAVTVDAAGNAFLTGHTGLAGFPATPGAIAGDPSLDTGFILKLGTLLLRRCWRSAGSEAARSPSMTKATFTPQGPSTVRLP